MPVEINVTGEARALIEPFWPQWNEDNYAAFAAERVARQAELEARAASIESILPGLEFSADGATAETHRMSLRETLAQLQKQASTAQAHGSAAAMEAQSVFNAKNLLNAIGIDYQTKADSLMAENIATGGNQPMIQLAIEALKQIALIAAQVVQGGAMATHASLTSNMMGGLPVTSPPGSMPPMLSGMGNMPGWGMVPGMPQQFADPSFYGMGSGQSAMMGGGNPYSGQPGSLLASLANSAPGMAGSFGSEPQGGSILQEAARSISAGVAGAAAALGDAIENTPLGQFDPASVSGEQHGAGFLAETHVTADAHAAGAGGGGGLGGMPRGGGGGETTVQQTGGGDASEPDAEPDTRTTSASASFEAHTPLGDVAAHADGRIDTSLTSGAATAQAPQPMGAPGAAPAGGAPVGGGLGQTFANAGGGFAAGAGVGSEIGAQIPRRGAATRSVSNAAEEDRPHADGDDQRKASTRKNHGLVDPDPKVQRGLDALAQLARHYPGEIPLAALVDEQRVIVSSPFLFGLHPNLQPLGDGVLPLALAGGAVGEKFWQSWTGYADPALALIYAVDNGLLPTGGDIRLVCSGVPDPISAVDRVVTWDELNGASVEDQTVWGDNSPDIPRGDIEKLARWFSEAWGLPNDEDVTLEKATDSVAANVWATGNDSSRAQTASAWWLALAVNDCLERNDMSAASRLAWFMTFLPAGL